MQKSSVKSWLENTPHNELIDFLYGLATAKKSLIDLEIELEKNKTYEIGDKFLFKVDWNPSPDEYILSQISIRDNGELKIYIGLINAKDGNRWSEFIEFRNIGNAVHRKDIEKLIGIENLECFNLDN